MLKSSKKISKKYCQNASDEELLKLYAQNPSKFIFDEIHRRYYHLVIGCCLKILKNGDQAQDNASEIFLKIYSNLSNTNITSLQAWIYTVTKNYCYSELRKEKIEELRKEKFDEFQKSSKDFMENDAFDSLLSKEIANENLISSLEIALDKLKPIQRACIEAFYWGNQSYKQIAENKNLSIKQVKSYLQNGRRKLGVLLNKDA